MRKPQLFLTLISQKQLSPYLPLGLAFLIFLGCFFRFYHLDYKVYWHDEVHTSLRVAGYNNRNVSQEVFNNQILKPKDFLKFQSLNPEQSWADTWEALSNNPEHAPLYYILTRFWWEIWGNSVFATRSLSAICSLLVFPALFWLCWELFSVTSVGWIAMAIVAVSPFHVLYAQEARPYSLWTLTILLSSVALLKAINAQKSTLIYWFIYSLTLALTFYTSLLSVFVAIAHLIYVTFCGYAQRYSFLLAGIFSLILFLPWLIIMVQNSHELIENTAWMSDPISLPILIKSWELHFTSIWFDFDSKYNHFLSPRVIFILVLAIIYTIYYLWQQGQKKATVLLLSLILMPSLGLILIDLLENDKRSIMTRYFTPCFPAIEITVSYWLVFSRSKRLKIIIFSLIISLGILSCTKITLANNWWHKYLSYNHFAITKMINSSSQPLLISDNYQWNLGNLIALSYLLDNKVEIFPVSLANTLSLPPNKDLFIYNPSPELKSRFKDDLESTDIKHFYKARSRNGEKPD